MRTLYETLDIVKNYHYVWGGVEGYMCYAAEVAVEEEAISDEEADVLTDFIMNVLLDGQFISLEEKLCFDLKRFPDDIDTQSYWENVLKELKEQEK